MSVHCRRNLASLGPEEMKLFRDTVFQLHEQGRYQKYVQFHGFVSNLGHSGPAFLPWHRFMLREFEKELQSINSQVTLPYWDFTNANVDTNGNSLIWTDDLFKGPASQDCGTVTFTWTGQDNLQKSWTVQRNAFDPTAVPVDPSSVNNALAVDTYHSFQDAVTNQVVFGFRRTFEYGAHGAAHVWLGISEVNGQRCGDQSSFATAVNDPFFMLLHCHIDRIWSIWQQQRKLAWLAANPGQPYPADEPATDYFYDGLAPATTWPTSLTPTTEFGNLGVANRHNLDDVMWPWDGTESQPGNSATSFAPWNMPGMAETYTPRMSLSSIDMGYIYDTDIPSVELTTPNLVFNSVPENETTVRAIVFDVRACAGQATFEIIQGPGSDFGAPFGTQTIFTGSHGNEDGEARLWISFTGTTAGSMTSGQVTVQCVETTEQWVVQITADTIARPTVATALVLDRSGSMNSSAGLGDSRQRMDVLKQVAPIFVDLLRDDDGIAVASFNHDATQDLVVQLAGIPTFGAGRIQAKGAITSLAPGGATSIGDGIEAGHGLVDPVSGFDSKALVVFTDGHENASKTIAQVASLLNARVFAIGLGAPSQLNPSALDAVTSSTGGYLIMTGDPVVDELRLSKYFLQVLAGVTNTDVVLDPEGALKPGTTHRIKFQLTDADYSTDVILVVPRRGVIDIVLETPSGGLITPANIGVVPGALYHEADHLSFYRMTLPAVAGGTTNHGGTWSAILKVDDKGFEELRSHLRRTDNIKALRSLDAHGVRYQLVVNANSNLNMQARALQKSREIGADVNLRVRLTEIGLPHRGQSRVWAEIRSPEGKASRIHLQKNRADAYVASFDADAPGTYTMRVRAHGQTLRGHGFTREQLLTASVWEGGDKPIPKDERDLPPPSQNEKPADDGKGGTGGIPTIDPDTLQEILRRLRFRIDLGEAPLLRPTSSASLDK